VSCCVHPGRESPFRGHHVMGYGDGAKTEQKLQSVSSQSAKTGYPGNISDLALRPCSIPCRPCDSTDCLPRGSEAPKHPVFIHLLPSASNSRNTRGSFRLSPHVSDAQPSLCLPLDPLCSSRARVGHGRGEMQIPSERGGRVGRANHACIPRDWTRGRCPFTPSPPLFFVGRLLRACASLTSAQPTASP
jgi:hypothetical protein